MIETNNNKKINHNPNNPHSQQNTIFHPFLNKY